MMKNVDLAVIADDLTGATESASTALLRVSRSTVLLSPHGPATAMSSAAAADCPPDGAPCVLTLDTHSRHLESASAAGAAREAARIAGNARLVVKKVDSLLRGNIGAEVQALRDALGRTPVVATSLPRLDRLVRDGVLNVRGVPLHETQLWHLESRSAPRSIAEALAPMATTVIGQDTVDAGVEALAQAIRSAEAAATVPVCDADDDEALLSIVEAATRVWERPFLVGSAALVAASVAQLDAGSSVVPGRHDRDGLRVREHEPVRDEVEGRPTGLGHAQSVLAVIGTRAHQIGTQLDRLASSAAYRLVVDPGELLSAPDAITARLGGVPPTGLSIVALDPAAPVDPSRSSALATALAAAVAPVARRFDAIVATGGETARALLDALGVDRLDVIAEIEPGAVVSRTPAGQDFVTRPGSFGDAGSLLRITRRLLPSGATTEENS